MGAIVRASGAGGWRVGKRESANGGPRKQEQDP